MRRGSNNRETPKRVPSSKNNRQLVTCRPFRDSCMRTKPNAFRHGSYRLARVYRQSSKTLFHAYWPREDKLTFFVLLLLRLLLWLLLFCYFIPPRNSDMALSWEVISLIQAFFSFFFLSCIFYLCFFLNCFFLPEHCQSDTALKILLNKTILTTHTPRRFAIITAFFSSSSVFNYTFYMLFISSFF